MTKKQKYVIGRLAMPVQGLRSHPLQEIYRMDFATVSQVLHRQPNKPSLGARNDEKR